MQAKGTMTHEEKVIAALAATFFPAMPNEAEAARTEGKGEDVVRYWEMQGDMFPNFVKEVLRLVSEYFSPTERKQLFMVLKALSTKPGTLVMGGPQRGLPRSFPKLPVAKREKIMQKWARAPVPELNKGAKGLKSLLMLVLFRFLEGGQNPLSKALRYPGPDPERPVQPAPTKTKAEAILESALLDLTPVAEADVAAAKALLASKGLKVSEGTKAGDLVVECDAVVVGSGAGGGVAAGVLAKSGMRVIVLEKGRYTRAADLSLHESQAFETMYERGGIGLGNTDMSMNLLAGATVGGGTRINWCASFPTPEHVRREWADKHGLPNFASGRFTRALDAVCEGMGVYVGIPEHSRHNACLGAGLEEMGSHRGEIPRNCPKSASCGHCSLGCASGEKRDVTHTFLAEAAGHGATILCGVFAEKVLVEKTRRGMPSGRVSDFGGPLEGDAEGKPVYRKLTTTGVLVSVLAHSVPGSKRGKQWRLIIKAPVVVSSGGTLHTPALLLRSKVTCKGHVGRNLHLHPATIVFGHFPEGYKGQSEGQAKDSSGTIKMWTGGMMSTFSNEVADWHGTGYGPMLMTPSTHAGGWAGTLPWSSGADFKHFLFNMADTSPVLVIVRDRDAGRIRIDKQGLPVIDYWPSAFDRESLVKGIEFALNALAAAGAAEVGSYQGLPRHKLARNPDGTLADPAAFAAYLKDVREFGVKKHRVGVMSAHQMGSARMGSSPKNSVCDGEGECWQAAGLYIADASAFPTASGINPMITAGAIAYMVAEGIATRWAAKNCTTSTSALPSDKEQTAAKPLSTALLVAANATGKQRTAVQLAYEA